MKPLILAASVLLASPAHAWQILPGLYATTFCEMRRLGMSLDDAITVASKAAAISGPDAPNVMLAGRPVRSDALVALTFVDTQCPELAR